MERQSDAPEMEGLPADPVTDRTTPDGETGIEEGMMQLRVGDQVYPERPGAGDCTYYLRTGLCAYGDRCRFNHPRDRNLALAIRTGGGEYPERFGRDICQYYLRTGMCKYGASCKYHHPREGGGLASPMVPLNFLGYPIRLGERECSYYVKTGRCKFGTNCRFHHPQPSGLQVPEPIPVLAPAGYPTVQLPVPSSQQYGVLTGDWPLSMPALFPGSYMHGPYGSLMLPHGMVPLPGWNSHLPPLNSFASPSAQSSLGAGPSFGVPQLPSSSPSYGGPYPPLPSPAGSSGISQNEHAFPERPGQPECEHYMKTGDCKYRSACKYHHPSQRSGPITNIANSPMSFPLHPGEPVCSEYASTGVCKSGSSCKCDHPMGTLSCNISASSVPDLAVLPFPMGLLVPTLAPSFSSLELRPELMSAPHREGSPTSVGIDTSSSAPIFSRNNTLPHSITQQPAQSSTASAGSSGHVGEGHTSS